MSTQGGRKAEVSRFLEEHEWVGAPFTVTFLAAGEYNENYLVQTDAETLVFRINHGTQLGLENQIGYEYTVLTLVAPSGVTPRPRRLCESHELFPRGVLLMEYLPGRPLDYRVDLDGAAACFARIHATHYDAASGELVTQADPVGDIIRECEELLSRHPDHPLPEAGRKIRTYMEHVRELARSSSFDGEALCIVNTEVNSGNFLVNETHEGNEALGTDEHTVRLVDWEKAVASVRYQDLGHFLVPTTTLWKSDFRFDRANRERFLRRYYELADPPVSFTELDRRTRVLEETILLRAFSWVYMAWAEYTSGARPLSNQDTFRTMESYLEHIDEFLRTP